MSAVIVEPTDCYGNDDIVETGISIECSKYIHIDIDIDTCVTILHF